MPTPSSRQESFPDVQTRPAVLQGVPARAKRWARSVGTVLLQHGSRRKIPPDAQRVLIAVNRHMTIGNGILLEPTVRLLRRHLAKAHVTMLASGACCGVFAPTALVDRTMPWDSVPADWFLSGRSDVSLDRFDVIVKAFGSPIPLPVEWAAARVARFVTTRDFFPGTFYTDIHETDMTLDPIAQRLGVRLEEQDRYPLLHLTDDELAFGLRVFSERAGDGSVLGIHAGCNINASSRRWPVERFGEVARLARAANVSVALFGGPDDVAVNSTLRQLLNEDVVDFSCAGSFRETAAILRHCAAFVTNDSALMHAANAVAVPLVAIFGPTLEIKSYPRAPGERSTVLFAPNCPCRPCYNMRPATPDECPHHRCLHDVAAGTVWTAVDQKLRYRDPRPC